MPNRKKIIGLVFLYSLLAPSLGLSNVIVSVDRATFQTAVAGGNIEFQDFESFMDLAPFTDPRLTITPSIGDPFVTDEFLASTPPNGLASDGNRGTVIDNGDGTTRITDGFFTPDESVLFQFLNPITAFAIDINTFGASDGDYVAGIPMTGDSISSLAEVFFGQNTGQFIGFVTDTPFTSLLLSVNPNGSNLPFTLDTLVFGDAAEAGIPIPIPAALWLFCSALVGMIGLKRN